MHKSDTIFDRITINKLTTRCIIGINREERIHPQDVEIDITLHTDIRRAAAEDDIAFALNYRDIKKAVLDMVEHSSFNLLERLTEEVAAIALQDPAVHHADVTVAKVGALRYARDVAISITRFREDSGGER